ncbi:MAG: intein-containing RctB family protein [Chloroflexota bacterium]|nr:intein-containing RctB family protein [Chloroflexota bacterium]
MLRKQDFERISDFVWQVPQSFRGDMRAPARLYASQELLDDALQDESVNQLVNTATLPGIVKYAISMPDIHQGYGFPIGGVVATKLPDGVISPGGVGYDINCLAGGTRVLHKFGYTLPIANMESTWTQDSIACQDFSHEHPTSTGVLRWLKQKPRAQVHRMTTETGEEIIATADHPFWTPEGMIQLGNLPSGARVAVFPFVGIPFDKPSDTIIADRALILRTLKRHDKDSRGNASQQILNQLEHRHLLPLRLTAPQMPPLLRLLGYVWGDGTIYFEGKRGGGMVAFWGKPEDLQEIRADVQALGFTPSRIYSRERRHTIKTFYAEYPIETTETSFKVGSSAFAALLAALGAPVGNKTQQDFEMPGWLLNVPLWQKRLFLAALFGAELSAPKPFKIRNYNFYTPLLSLTKRKPFLASGRRFMRDLGQILAEFGVETKTISVRVENKSHRLRLVLSSQPASLLNLWSKVGFEYNQSRRALANVATQYIKQKQSVVSERARAAGDAVALQNAGAARAEIFARLTSPHINQRFIERSLYEGRGTPPRVAANFSMFDAYRTDATAGLGDSGMVWARVARNEEIPFDDPVYDFTVAHHDHNFIANGFVVSNCGVRLLASHVSAEEIAPYVQDLANALYRNCPSGVGSEGSVPLNAKQLDDVLENGSEWALRNNYARREDLNRTEEFGKLAGADAGAVSNRAKARGKGQLGTLGAGNHFIEIDHVVEVFDADVADRLGLFPDQVVVQIHCGSRGLGHQVCTDYVNDFQRAVREYNIELPDRELVCAPFSSPEAQQYFKAMAAAANYACANRQILAYHIRHSFEQALAGRARDFELQQIYDIAHNMAKVEEHVVDGARVKVCVHRKGATRAFGPGAGVLPDDLRDIGQPVLIPGSMGTASYVLVGTAGSMEQTFGSSCHGAGRVMSRSKAKREVRGEKLRDELTARGIVVRAGSMPGLAEEAPQAYKDVSRVVEVVHRAGIGRKVARLEPIAVIKG